MQIIPLSGSISYMGFRMFFFMNVLFMYLLVHYFFMVFFANAMCFHSSYKIMLLDEVVSSLGEKGYIGMLKHVQRLTDTTASNQDSVSGGH